MYRKTPPWIALLLYKSLVRSKLTYAARSTTYYNKTNIMEALPYIQNRALRAAYRTGIRTRIKNLEEKSRLPPIHDHYKETSKNTLLRIITNKNVPLLKTMFTTHPRKSRAYNTPPLDHTTTHFTAAEREKIRRDIQDIILKPP